MSYTLISNGTVIDGNGGAPIADGAVLIQDNVIRVVGRKADIRLPSEAVNQIDAGGGWILPGLIDTHVHVMLEGLNIPQMMTTPFSFNFYKALGAHAAHHRRRHHHRARCGRAPISASSRRRQQG